MPITKKQVEYVAHLSRLELEEGEKERFSAQLDDILQYVEKLNELDTSEVEPLVHAAPRANVFRPDSAGQSLPPEEALRNAPDRTGGHFKVPRIIG